MTELRTYDGRPWTPPPPEEVERRRRLFDQERAAMLARVRAEKPHLSERKAAVVAARRLDRRHRAKERRGVDPLPEGEQEP